MSRQTRLVIFSQTASLPLMNAAGRVSVSPVEITASSGNAAAAVCESVCVCVLYKWEQWQPPGRRDKGTVGINVQKREMLSKWLQLWKLLFWVKEEKEVKEEKREKREKEEKREEITGTKLSSIHNLDASRTRKLASDVAADNSHLGHGLFKLRPSGGRSRALDAPPTRHRNSFFPQAVALVTLSTNSTVQYSSSSSPADNPPLSPEALPHLGLISFNTVHRLAH